MTLDYGVRVRRRGLRLGVLAAVVGPVVVLLVFGGFWLLQRGRAVREARDWTIDGPACPELSAAAFAARGQEAPQAFEFGQASFARRFGHVSCALIAYGGGRGFGRYPVCQFTSPDALFVRAGRRTAFYVPGLGQPATVSVKHGRPACVTASRFTASTGIGPPQHGAGSHHQATFYGGCRPSRRMAASLGAGAVLRILSIRSIRPSERQEHRRQPAAPRRYGRGREGGITMVNSDAVLARGRISARRCLLAATLVSAGAVAFAQAAAAAPAADPAGGAQVSEVVVTAQFRQQNLQSTPLAITALSSQMLEARNQTNVTDISNAAPNVTIRMAPEGFGNSAQVFIRGVGQTDFKYALEPGVGMYVDDVYYPTLFGTTFDLLDLDRIEILRGPQGTLAGKNSIGGAVKLYSKKPTGDGHGYAQATYGSYNRAELRAGIDVPVVADKLFLRVSGVGKRRSGYVDRLDFTCVHPELSGSLPRNGALSPGDCKVGTEGGQRAVALRAAARWLPTSTIEVNLVADMLADDSESPAETLLYVDPRGYAGPATTANPLGQTAAWNYQTNQPRFGVLYDDRFLPANHYQSYATFTDPVSGHVNPAISTTHSWGVEGDVQWQLGGQLTLRSITAYRQYNGEFSQDQDLTPLNLQTLYHHLYHHQFSEEVRLTGQLLNGRVDWVLGGFHINSTSTDKGFVDIGQSSRAVGPNYFNTAGLVFYLDDPVTDRNNSGFVHATAHVTDKLNVEGGVRYSDEKKVYTFYRSNPVLSAINGPAPPAQFSRWDYRADVNYTWQPGLMTYASISTGFRGGGVNPRPFTPSQALPFGPEKLTAYEIGLKSELFERRVRLNLAGFFNKYRDLQLSASGVIDGFSVVIPRNVGEAHVKGIEAEVEAHPTDHMMINASGSWLDFNYVDLGTAAGVPGGPCLSCKPPLSPTWKFNVGAQYEVMLAGGSSLTPRLDLTYQSKVFNEVTNNPRSAQPGYAVLDGRVTWRSPDDSWEAAVFVTNITDKFYWYSISDGQNTFGVISGQPSRPREWAVSVKRNF